MAAAQLVSLEAVLRLHFPGDYLCPVKLGEKQPAFSHKGVSGTKPTAHATRPWRHAPLERPSRPRLPALTSHHPYSHARYRLQGTWSWAKWTKHNKECLAGQQDVCILLQEIVCVDVDSVEQALELEGRFPILTRTVMESTKRGRHYYFARTENCDVQGFFDGAGQVRQGSRALPPFVAAPSLTFFSPPRTHAPLSAARARRGL